MNWLAVLLSIPLLVQADEPEPEDEEPPHLTWGIFIEQVYTEEEINKLKDFAQEKGDQHIESKFMFE